MVTALSPPPPLPQDKHNFDTADTVNRVLLGIPVPSYPLLHGLLYFTLERVIEDILAAEYFQPLPNPYVQIQWYIVALVGQAGACVLILFFIRLVKAYW